MPKAKTIEDAHAAAKKHEGVCLSTQYENLRQMLLWKCREGHRWEAGLASILKGVWCKQCISNEYLRKIKEYASAMGGKCLSTNYENNFSPMGWECLEGHQWTASSGNITNGRWCPECAATGRSRDQRLGIEVIKDYAREMGGVCLSTEYVNAHTHVRIRCSEGHEWDALPLNLRKGSWCLQCTGKAADTIEVFQELAKAKGGECLSKTFTGQKSSRLHMRCAAGHEWHPWSTTIKAGGWCKKCFMVNAPYNEARKPLIEELQAFAIERNGKLISTVYIKNDSKLTWECESGHQFEKSYSKAKAGQWCPTCTGYLGEEIVRSMLEGMTGHKFPKARPTWLRGPNGFLLELDGYSQELKLAFEHHGEHHHSSNTLYSKTSSELRERKRLDKFKIKACESHGTDLIITPEVPREMDTDELFKFLLSELNRLEMPIVNDPSPEVAWGMVHRSKFVEHMEKMRVKAISNEGKLLSTEYIGMAKKYQWQCKEGHVWLASGDSVMTGHWCGYCSGLHQTIDRLIEAAEKEGGKLLEDEYRGMATTYLWECSQGHQWQGWASNILKGVWCPECANARRWKTRRANMKGK